MSAYSAPLEKTPLFNNKVFQPKIEEKSDLQVNSLIANSIYGTNTASLNSLAYNIGINGGNHTNYADFGGSFSNYKGMIWQMSGDATGNGFPSSTSSPQTYDANYKCNFPGDYFRIGVIDSFNTRGFGCDTIGNGFPNESASQYNTSTGIWTCNTTGKYLIQVNLSVRSCPTNQRIRLWRSKSTEISFDWEYLKGDSNNTNSNQQLTLCSILELKSADYLGLELEFNQFETSYTNIRFSGPQNGIQQQRDSVWRITRIVG